MKYLKFTSLIYKAIVPALLTSILLTTPAVAENSLEKAREAGSITIAIGNAPPWAEMTSDGKITGGAPDVAIAVLKKLGIPEVKASIFEYGAMIPGLVAGRYDLVSAGLFMNSKRCAAVLYSEPDVCGTAAFAVKAGNPLKLESYENIAQNPSIKVGVCGGCVEEKAARSAGVSPSQIVTIPDEQSAIKMLQDGRIGVYAYTTVSITSLLKKANDPGLAMVSPVLNTQIQCAGSAFRKSDKAFRDAYDAALKEMKDNGEFDAILSKYGFPTETAKTTSRETLCASD